MATSRSGPPAMKVSLTWRMAGQGGTATKPCSPGRSGGVIETTPSPGWSQVLHPCPVAARPERPPSGGRVHEGMRWVAARTKRSLQVPVAKTMTTMPCRGESVARGIRAGVSPPPCGDQGRSLPPPGPPASLPLFAGGAGGWQLRGRAEFSGTVAKDGTFLVWTMGSTSRLKHRLTILHDSIMMTGPSGLSATLSSRPEFPQDRKSTRLNSSHIQKSRMPSSA